MFSPPLTTYIRSTKWHDPATSQLGPHIKQKPVHVADFAAASADDHRTWERSAMSEQKQYESSWDLFTQAVAGDRPILGFDPHALERGVQMGAQLGLDPSEIREAMTNPTRIKWSATYSACLFSAGRCTLSVWVNRDGGPYVKTILWSSDRDWDASHRMEVPGRAAR